jgi:hypothetical protein
MRSHMHPQRLRVLRIGASWEHLLVMCAQHLMIFVQPIGQRRQLRLRGRTFDVAEDGLDVRVALGDGEHDIFLLEADDLYIFWFLLLFLVRRCLHLPLSHPHLRLRIAECFDHRQVLVLLRQCSERGSISIVYFHLDQRLRSLLRVLLVCPELPESDPLEVFLFGCGRLHHLLPFIGVLGDISANAGIKVQQHLPEDEVSLGWGHLVILLCEGAMEL